MEETSQEMRKEKITLQLTEQMLHQVEKLAIENSKPGDVLTKQEYIRRLIERHLGNKS